MNSFVRGSKNNPSKMFHCNALLCHPESSPYYQTRITWYPEFADALSAGWRLTWDPRFRKPRTKRVFE